jgi:aspartate/methionine/tyrosine aminotransferase
MEYTKLQGAFYVFPSINKYGFSSTEMRHLLLKKARVAVMPGDAFGSGGEGFIRMAYSTSYEEIDHGTNRIDTFLKTL